jgi:hypothetical protein
LDTNALAPEPEADALGNVATVKLVVAGIIVVLDSCCKLACNDTKNKRNTLLYWSWYVGE